MKDLNNSPDQKRLRRSFIRKIPGFRSGKPWKMVMAGIGYFFLFLVIISIATTGDKQSKQNVDTKPKQAATPATTIKETQDSSPEKLPEKPDKKPALGITRQEVVNLFSQKEIGFKFEEGKPVDGSPQVIGKSPDGLAFLQVIGPKENIESLSMMFGAPNDRPDILLKNAIYALGMLKNYAPGSIDWFNEEIKKASKGNIDSSKNFNNRTVRIQTLKELGMICVTIQPKK